VFRDLLLYLRRNRDGDLGECQIGIEVLGRRPDFDTRIDATVRVSFARLRQPLHSYYESEGSNDPIRLSIPAGVYRIIFTRVLGADVKSREPAATDRALNLPGGERRALRPRRSSGSETALSGRNTLDDYSEPAAQAPATKVSHFAWDGSCGTKGFS
jgi:hypothetical protein